VVFNNPAWDWTALNFDSDVAALEKAFQPAVAAIQPDLRPFAERGGKLILYQGWNDHIITPGNTVDYYTAVLYTIGVTRTNESVRLFMAPGMMGASPATLTAALRVRPLEQ
jgi:feruloyl esterase